MIVKEDNFAYWVEATTGRGDAYYFCSVCGVVNQPTHLYCPCCKRLMVLTEEEK